VSLGERIIDTSSRRASRGDRAREVALREAPG
jgi:hypothetical protein